MVKEIDLRSLKTRVINKIPRADSLFLGIPFMPGEKAILYNDWPDLYVLDLENKDLPPQLFIENAFNPDVWYPK